MGEARSQPALSNAIKQPVYPCLDRATVRTSNGLRDGASALQADLRDHYAERTTFSIGDGGLARPGRGAGAGLPKR